MLLAGCYSSPRAPRNSEATVDARAEQGTARGRAEQGTARGRAEQGTARRRAEQGTARRRAEQGTARGRADRPAPSKPGRPTAATFTVIARLTDAGRSVPPCGVIRSKTVMKFGVRRVVEGQFEATVLYAGVSCPEMPPTRAEDFRWVTGADYELRLATAGLHPSGALHDAFEAEPGPRFELLHVEPNSTKAP